jgi:N6-L-threonylcarbamoyladenine synthase
VVGETLDDAAGEAYDKVARILDLPYPGGPHIDKLAQQGRDKLAYPRAWLGADSLDFSFSGLKSAVINDVHNTKQRGESINKANIAASFQASVVDVLVEKTFRAAQEYDVKQLIVAGGVAANQGLRTAITARFKEIAIPVSIPAIQLCTDNAAMIAAAGSILYDQKRYAGWDLNGRPSLLLR